MFCRSGHKVECKKQYYLLDCVSEAMRQSWKFGRGDCHAKYPMSSLSFMLRSPQSLGRVISYPTKLCERCCRNEVFLIYCTHKGLGIITS